MNGDVDKALERIEQLVKTHKTETRIVGVFAAIAAVLIVLEAVGILTG